MRILQADNQEALTRFMQEIKVDPYGIKIMVPKGMAFLVKMNALSNISANILKQEMLSLGADAAIAKDALTGKVKKTDCLLMGNLAQLLRLNEKLKKQPFGLNRLAQELSLALANYQNDKFTIKLGIYSLTFSRRPYIMGIVNLTPDSFSGDGLYRLSAVPCLPAGRSCQLSATIDFIEKMVRDGADIIDIGGESSRPGRKPVSIAEELSRTIPIIKKAANKIKVPISIDTYKPEVAQQALDNGAVMINDISGLRNPKMRKVVARYKAAVVIMHMKGNPCTMQKNPVYGSLVDEIIVYLDTSIKLALEAGIAKDKIMIDPGIGFGKTVGHNLEIIKRLKEFKILGFPILVGPSRKSFIGKILNLEPKERIFGTVPACVLAIGNGANMVRVHDVKEVKQAITIEEAINKIKI